jgi:hypothetical protein
VAKTLCVCILEVPGYDHDRDTVSACTAKYCMGDFF